MAEQQNASGNQEQQNKKKKSSLLWIILFIVALALFIVSGILYMNTSSEVKKLKEDKQQQRVYFKQELDSLMTEHNEVKSEYSKLTDSLQKKDSVIKENAKQIDQLLDTKWKYQKVQKKLSKLREIAQGYLTQIDSLYRVNKELKEENKEIKTKFRKEQQMTQELTREKEELNKKVNKAAQLNVHNIDATGIKITWFNNEKETDKARRTDKFNICFTVGENELTEKGEKTLYFRVATPSGKIMTPTKSSAYTFEYDEQKMQYTIKYDFDYDGESFRKCID
ncbi:MAG: hypothetical protein K9I47_02005, partial [Bacteroidales bacterium]|nr:hypothetical protein [Bacteroidales bacterium]